VDCEGSIAPGKVCVEPDSHGPGGWAGWGRRDDEGFQVGFQGRPIGQGPVGRGRRMMKKGGVETDKDWDVIRPRQGERIRPFRQKRYYQGASRGQVNVHARGVEEGKTKFCCHVEVGSRTRQVVLFETAKGVRRRVVEVEITQCESRVGKAGED